MEKHQRLSSYQLDDLPEEVILKMLGFLNIKELLLCGQVSMRLRAIANDESLWLKLNLRYRAVPYDFIERAAGNGCQYLSLVGCRIIGLTGKSESSSFNLKYLNYRKLGRVPRQDGLKLVQNCSSLQKLSVADLTLDSNDIQYICQNTQTLQVLDLINCNYDPHDLTEPLKDLFTNCTHLTELNIGLCESGRVNDLLDPQIQALVDNLTPTILKVDFGAQRNLRDEDVKKMIKRFNNITHLNLSDTAITNDSVHSVIEQLKTSLEKLDVCGTDIDFATLLQLKSMPVLKNLFCFDGDTFTYGEESEDIKNLKQQLPQIRINEEGGFCKSSEEKVLVIALPYNIENESSYDMGWIWEIRAKKQDLFAKRK